VHIVGSRSDLAVGVGHSACPETPAAARECVRAAIGDREPAAGDLLLVFVTMAYDVALFFEAAAAEAGAATVIGCSAFACSTTASAELAGCSAAFIPRGSLSIGVGVIDRLDADIAGATSLAVAAARADAGPQRAHELALLLSDGLAGDLREVMRGAFSTAGALVPIIGGAAADALTQTGTYQYADGRLMTNGVIALWIGSDEPLGVGVEHGWRPTGDLMVVTRAVGNTVFELDGRPAKEAYLQMRAAVREDESSGLGATTSSSFAEMVMDGPLGLPTAAGRYEVRHVLSHTDDGALVMFGHVSDNSVVQVMASDADELLSAAGRAASSAVAQLGRPSRGALMFTCTARLANLADRATEEASAVAEGLGGAPACGFFTYGEFARTTGSSGFHNATIAVLAL
jgi:hypothetical protein